MIKTGLGLGIRPNVISLCITLVRLHCQYLGADSVLRELLPIHLPNASATYGISGTSLTVWYTAKPAITVVHDFILHTHQKP